MQQIARAGRNVALVSAALLVLTLATGCSRTLDVRVVDAETGAAVAGATVTGNPYNGWFFAMAGPKAHSGPDGVARLHGPTEGLRRIAARAPGYGGSDRGRRPDDPADRVRPSREIALWRHPPFTVEYRLPTDYRGVIRIRRYAGHLPPAGQRHVIVNVNPPEVAQDPTGLVEIDSAAAVDHFRYADGRQIPARDLAPDQVGLRADEAFYKAFARPRHPGEELWVFFVGTEREMRAVTEAARAR